MVVRSIRKATASLLLTIVLLIIGACSERPTKTTTPHTIKATLRPAAALPSGTLNEAELLVIWDDDGSPDGVIALLYLLKNPRVRVEAITVSCGEAHPDIFAQNLTRMLARIGRGGIPVAPGRGTPLEGNNAFPEPWRASTDIFWGVELPSISESVESYTASQLIVEVVKRSSEPVAIFLTGNHTNLAEALRLDPSIANRIKVVEVMGGALYVPGNIASDWPENPNQVAEWNIWVDPVAADEVFTFSLPIRLVPLDATNHVIWTEEDAANWEASDAPEGALASEILRWMLSSWYAEGVYAWDVVAAVDLTDPDVCQHIEKYVRIVTEPGDEQGKMVVDDSQPANTSVCLIPLGAVLKDHVAEVFQAP
jgi:pyrimidine-specific ribonucleoside hydrolase